MTANKLRIRHDYINNLVEMYEGKVDYSSGSRAREMAIMAADAALAGKIRLQGDAWFKALTMSGIPANISLKQLAALPAE